MSDESTAISSGGLVRGKDGKVSGRKILGLSGFPCGIGLAVFSIIYHSPWPVVGLALGIPLAFSLLMYQIVTAQNVKEIAASIKGGA